VPLLLLLFWACACAPVLVDVYVWYMVLHVSMPCSFLVFLMFIAALIDERNPADQHHARLATGCNKERHEWECNKLYCCMYAYMTVFCNASVLPSALIPQHVDCAFTVHASCANWVLICRCPSEIESTS